MAGVTTTSSSDENRMYFRALSQSQMLTLGLSTIAFTAAAIVGGLHKLGLFYQWSHKVYTKSKKNGGDLVADVLKSHGVKNVFTLVGGHISPILVGCEKQGIRVVDTRHEVTSVFAADAVARLSGTIGVAAVTAGPGVTNTVTAVKNAQMAESPVLLLGGAAATLLKGRGSLQDIDQLSLFKSLCKFTASISTIKEIVPTLRKAIQIAQSGTPGPVFVEFPIDVLYPYEMVKREMGMKDSGKGIFQKIVNWYLQNHLNNLFSGAFDERDTSPLQVKIPMPSSNQVQKCVELLTRAKKPVFVLGSQVTLPPIPAEKICSALEHIGVPCFLGGMSRGLLGKKSPIQIRQQRRDALKEADLIFLAGTVCDFRLGYGRSLNKRAKIITVNRSKEQLLKNSDMFWKPTLAIQADAGTLLNNLADSLKHYKCDPEWIQSLRQRDVDKENANRKKGEEITDRHLNPVKLLHQTDEIMSEDSIIVADGGDFVGTAAYILRPRGPLRWLDPGAFGTLGVGGGFALGAKICRPESEVWIIYGDGSLGFSVAEFDTFTRHKLPVLALVGNDASWNQIAREQVPMFGSSIACDLSFLSYDTVAKGFGGKGYQLDRSNESQTTEILKQAQADYKNGHSVLINALIGKTNFREGSISV